MVKKIGKIGKTIIHKVLRRKLKIKQHEAQLKPGLNLGAPEG